MLPLKMQEVFSMWSLGTASVRFLLSATRTRAQALEIKACSFCFIPTFPAQQHPLIKYEYVSDTQKLELTS